MKRTRKLCRAQHSSITTSRTPSFHSRIRSLTMRQRFTLLLTCSIRSRRQCSAWLASCCSRVSSFPQGFFVGMRISTWGSVNARKPRSYNSRLPAGKGYGMASAIRLSWCPSPKCKPVSSSRSNGLPPQLRPRGRGTGLLQPFRDRHTLIPEIGNNPLAVKPVGGLRGQPDHGSLHDLWLHELVPDIAQSGSRHVSVRCPTWHQHIGRHAAAFEFLRHGRHERFMPGLGGTVRRPPFAPHRVHARGHANNAPPALAPQMTDHGPGHEKGPAEVDGDHPTPDSG